MTAAATIRAARRDDVPAVYAMLRDSAGEQGSEASLCVSEKDLANDGFGDIPRFQVLLAELSGMPVGLALYFFIYSTWTSRNGLYLEDLYVKPEFRRQGIARRLMQRLAQVAGENGCGRMTWLVLRENPAVRFYEMLGAAALVEWMPMQMKVTEMERPSRNG